jgi:hypothetical protein
MRRSGPALRNVQSEIEYAIVALGLSANEVSSMVRGATGVIVDANVTGFLQTLNTSQLEATWKRLSEDLRWSHP